MFNVGDRVRIARIYRDNDFHWADSMDTYLHRSGKIIQVHPGPKSYTIDHWPWAWHHNSLEKISEDWDE